MKVLDLSCTHGHSFEGWFGSEDDFQSQLERQLVECPMCGDTQVLKKLSAPRLNFGASAPQATSATPTREVAAMPSDPQLQAAWMKMVRHVMENTEDVGTQFAEEARRIHYGESDERNIRGQASRDETEALLDEGIAVMPLPIPKALKGPIQ